MNLAVPVFASREFKGFCSFFMFFLKLGDPSFCFSAQMSFHFFSKFIGLNTFMKIIPKQQKENFNFVKCVNCFFKRLTFYHIVSCQKLSLPLVCPAFMLSCNFCSSKLLSGSDPAFYSTRSVPGFCCFLCSSSLPGRKALSHKD